VRHWLAAGGTNRQVRVTDTGQGIAAAHPPHLFVRLHRSDPARTHASGGSGIGTGIGIGVGIGLTIAPGGDIHADPSGGPTPMARYATAAIRRSRDVAMPYDPCA
jgi:signal transduction histidine kinase